MDREEFLNLQPCDVVKHVSGHEGYIVTGNYSTCDDLSVTSVRNINMSNPQEWVLVEKKNFKNIKINFHIKDEGTPKIVNFQMQLANKIVLSFWRSHFKWKRFFILDWWRLKFR